ncbi:dihydrolipoyl dehydrogenase [Luteitalea sp.]|uniref:dihydrolipoyl dehydrogenase n=1 Tax=Luteitalea sp. TaxID=2004800 RepID=UPI0025BC8B3A|nr:dihydrolipoyl dehydrogenase [Luteitalea sp.]
MADNTPLVVLGAGPGGHAAAFLAADLGMQVVLIDEEVNPGGVCTYRGCIPSKALLHVAKLLSETRHASAWGIDFGEPHIDIDRLRAFKQGVVDRLTGGLGQLTRQRKITYIQGRASFVDAHTLKVQLTQGGEQDVRFEKLIIATGSRPSTLPNVPVSKDRLLDSTSALEMASVPKTMLVIGGGYIGLELGTVYAALGTEVSVVEMFDRILPGADRDLVNVLAKRVRSICKQVLTSTKVVSMEEKADGVHVTFEGEVEPKTQVFEKVLVSIGRRPNGNIPGIDSTGVEVTPRGFITVDPQRRTTVPHIYAIGDVAGDPMLAHKATYDAKIAVEHIAGHKVAFEPAAIPAVVFTDPELAWCGITEAEAKEQGIAVEVAKFPWGASGRATTVDRNDGLTKLILEPGTGRVLGVGIVGVHAGELIAEGVLAVEMAATAADLKMTIHAHPTLGETVMESAEVYFGTATNFYKPKK